MGIKYTGILLMTAFMLCAGCSGHEPEPSAETLSAGVTIRTRMPQDVNATENELINTWWMAFVDRDGIVRLILDRPSEKTGAVDYEEFSFTIASGTYTVYAFANIDRSTFEPVFAEGKTAPDLSAATWDKTGKIGDYVPMTGVLRNVSIQDGGQRYFSIEVVRLWAKLCFEFTTDASQPVTVSRISMTPALTGAVSLLPDYNSLGGAPVLPAETVCSALELDTDLTITQGQTLPATFYVLESTAAAHATGRYPISFDLQHGDGQTQTVSALAYQLQYINRNDFVTIPVRLTDWLVNMDVDFYPPIGGYPAVVIETAGNEYFAKFGSAGQFVIRPAVTTADGTPVNNKDINITIATSDPDGVLSVAPSRDDTTYEITGEIGAAKTGTAVIDLTITVKDDALQHKILRKFYIIRQNS